MFYDQVTLRHEPNAFCAVRPPGHHASQRRGMRFCIFNNVAIGARHAARRYGVERILIAGWDVHHGNGTQEVFWSDGSVLFFDTHQRAWYPGTGSTAEIARQHARGRIVSVLEGGYALDGLARAVDAHVGRLSARLVAPTSTPQTENIP